VIGSPSEHQTLRPAGPGVFLLGVAVSLQLSAKDEQMKDFRELLVWRKSRGLVLSVYQESQSFPREEIYGLTSQLRRAAGSIPANIAEGCGRNGDAELARFMQIAAGSASEAEYHLLLARDLGWLEPKTYDRLQTDVSEIKRMLTSFIQKPRRPSADSRLIQELDRLPKSPDANT
jgi:four helix bundle protein